MDSPVIMDSSIADWPSRMTPSTGTFSPGRTTTTSPTFTCSTGTSTSFPSRMTVAIRGARSMRRRMASEALPLAFSSKYRPRRIREMMKAAVS